MRKLGKFYSNMIKELIKNILFHFKKNKYTLAPVFIIGCGRSGTTILGKTLSNHPKIKYLNEKRDLWHKSYPEFNIWSGDVLNSKLYANEKDYDKEKSSELRNLFFREQVLGNASILLEKLPINNFRLKFLQKCFPKAKYIYLSRNGLEVSRSIEKKIQKNNWYIGSKLKLLKKYSGVEIDTQTDQLKGMWEWKLSMNESHLFFQQLNRDKFIHLSYQDFIENTKDSLKKIFEFLQLETNDKFLEIISQNIKRQNNAITKTEDKKLLEIGGEILKQTINNSYPTF